MQKLSEEAYQTSAQIVANLEKVAQQLHKKISEAKSPPFFLIGLLVLLLTKLTEGFIANYAYERAYRKWLSSKSKVSGTSWKQCHLGILILLIVWPLTIFRFSVANSDNIIRNLTQKILGLPLSLSTFPIEKQIFSPLANLIDSLFDWLAVHFGDFFNGINLFIAKSMTILEILLIETPWPITMLLLTILSFRISGMKLAIFTLVSVAYLALMGLWEMSMATIALVGVGTALCLMVGLPLGIWFGRKPSVYRIALPFLDFMQTMPAFVYLIPIIAFFGTGKSPGILATLIFAMPPVVRLTALGIQNVPETTKEAARAFGCSSWQLLWHIEIPLAIPSIMTGINQTIMMGLSMVVIAAFIGAPRTRCPNPRGPPICRQRPGYLRGASYPFLRYAY